MEGKILIPAIDEDGKIYKKHPISKEDIVGFQVPNFDEVIKYVKRQIKLSDKKIIFVIVPLLFESGMDEMMDEIWYVYISKEEQIKRLMLRDNIDYEYALKKINSQMSMEEKRKIMSKKQNVVLIDNSLDLCYTYKSIEKLMNEREM